MPPHRHDFHELIVPMAGRMGVSIGGQEFSAAPGSVLFYPRGVHHREWTDPQRPVTTCFLAFEWSQDVSSLPLQAEDHDGRIHELAMWLHRDRDLLHTPAALAQRQAMLELILSTFIMCATRRPQEDELVRKVRQHVRQKLSHPILLQELAEIASLSRFHFVRAYRKLTGRSPMADVRHLRLEHARELLLTTSLPLREIAPLCGLGSEYALSRAFSREFRHPPSRLRASATGPAQGST